MPQVTVYVREEDHELWKGVVKKSEFIHNALQNNSTYDGSPIVLREDIPEEALTTNHIDVMEDQEPAKIPTLAEIKNEEVFGSLNPDVLVLTQDGIYDTEAEERVEATPEMVKELKKRGQVRN